jgi:hypothetical protein
MKGLRYFSLLLACCYTVLVTAQVNVPTGVSAPPQYNFTIAYPYNYNSGTRVNWVQTTDVRMPITDTALVSTLNGTQATVTTTYSDGLGRPVQRVTKAPTTADMDMIAAAFYDSAGRKPGELLPFAYGNNGKFKLDAFYRQSQYHSIRFPDEATYFNRTEYDDQTLYRSVKT